MNLYDDIVDVFDRDIIVSTNLE